MCPYGYGPYHVPYFQRHTGCREVPLRLRQVLWLEQSHFYRRKLVSSEASGAHHEVWARRPGEVVHIFLDVPMGRGSVGVRRDVLRIPVAPTIHPAGTVRLTSSQTP